MRRLHNWLFTRLSPFQGTLHANCNRFKQTTKLDADPKAIQQINVTQNATIFFTIEETKETVLDFSKGTLKV